MVSYKCIYCLKEVLSFTSIITHIIEDHGELPLKFSQKDGSNIKQYNFKIIPDMCRQQGRSITIKEKERKIHISRYNTTAKDSPYAKVLKVVEDSNNYTEPINAGEDGACCSLEDTEETDTEYTEIVSLLPTVIEELKRAGKMDAFMSFHKLVSGGKFPLDNIAFLLFLDVVRWFSMEREIYSMRYSDEIKLFWKTGLRLFHGRFLRFMGGPKCTSDDSTYPCAQNSKVNFAVPDRKMLQDEKKFVEGDAPGIMHGMIDILASCDKDQTKTYKVCVDGKKINPSSNGEVQLWGYEDSPTFDEKQDRLEKELTFLDGLKETIAKLVSFGHSEVGTCDDTDKECILKGSRKTVQLLSARLRDLRQLKVKKVLFLNKLIDKCEKDWRNSQFSMVISSIKTTIYKIENAIDELLQCNDTLCRYAAIIGNAASFFFTEQRIRLANQNNLVCLSNTGSDNDPPLMKQRSDAWHSLRKESAVTGSTINTAIGLDGLKKQREHLEIKAGNRPEKEIPQDLQQKFDHGTLNEINAVATLVSKYLPAFDPNSSFYEEGCYVEKENGRIVLIVSPDGSIRCTGDDQEVLYGVEIKCPFPGKTFTTSVHYGIPHYYVPQVLSEMHSLGVGKLLFLSYSEDSMTIHQISYDPVLWENIYALIKDVDCSHIPKKLSTYVSSLKADIREFCRSSKVQLLAELSSCIAEPCDHSSDINDGRIYHEGRPVHGNCRVQLRDVQKLILRCEELVKDCHGICAQRASEVLVFLVADLDRTYKAEIPHAFPVAFALKGYSMKTDQMRKMLQDVLTDLFVRGLYCPVVSYDGQWAKLAFQDFEGEPLTILELQKKVFGEVKKRTVKELCDGIFQTGIVKATNYIDVTEKLHIEKRNYGVEVGLKSGQRLFFMSSNLVSYLRTCRQQKKRTDTEENGNENVSVNDVLSNIPSEVLSNLDIDVFQSLSSIDSGTDNLTHMEINNDPLLFDQLYEEGDGEQLAPTMKEVNTTSTAHTNRDSEAVQEENDTPNSDRIDQNSIPSVTTNVITITSLEKMFTELQRSKEWSSKWAEKSFSAFKEIMSAKESMSKLMKAELLFCYNVFKGIHGSTCLRICKSWTKARIIDLMFEACTSTSVSMPTTVRRKRVNPNSLIALCRKAVRSLPKKVLNAIVAEHEFPEKVQSWREKSPFRTPTNLSDIGDVMWFSRPEYNPSTLSYIFSVLDPHHLLTNCRVKVCKDGFPERGIYRNAWLEVAKENKTNLKISHVEDLVDKQSDSIAMETFSVDVEAAMERLHYPNEAAFCRIIRQFHESEDAPGLTASERCQRRLKLREWLLEGVSFGNFPPYGSHIKGVPNVMFQGYLTNIDRRIQLFPFVKSGKFNVRSLGSLEAENFFGEFQDLDPKGSGVIKAEDIPSALEAACQMNHTRLMPDRPFYMSLSRAKVYPVNQLLADDDMDVDEPYIYPTSIRQISIKNHMFDSVGRSKRKARRKLVTIATPDEAARGVAPVRQHHKCDESKILPHKRLGIEID